MILEFPDRIISTLSSDKLQKENIQKEINNLDKSERINGIKNINQIKKEILKMFCF